MTLTTLPTGTQASTHGRQIAETLHVPAELVQFLSWRAIGALAETLACHVEAVRHADGGRTITLFWTEEDE